MNQVCIECFRVITLELTNKIEEKLSLPSEAITNTPLVEIRGKRSVCIENHRGIKEYTEDEVKVHVKRGQISIQGNVLKISCMNHRRIEVCGNIRAVVLE